MHQTSKTMALAPLQQLYWKQNLKSSAHELMTMLANCITKHVKLSMPKHPEIFFTWRNNVNNHSTWSCSESASWQPDSAFVLNFLTSKLLLQRSYPGLSCCPHFSLSSFQSCVQRVWLSVTSPWVWLFVTQAVIIATKPYPYLLLVLVPTKQMNTEVFTLPPLIQVDSAQTLELCLDSARTFFSWGFCQIQISSPRLS